VVFGQMAGSLLLDHFGVLHSRQPADALRVLGVVLVAVGALLVVKPWHQG
jgi:transporter family-2 protein